MHHQHQHKPEKALTHKHHADAAEDYKLASSQPNSAYQLNPSNIMHLQRTIGNQATMRMLNGNSTRAIQRETQNKDSKPTLNQDMEDHMGQKLVSNWLGSNLKMKEVVNEAVNRSVVLAGHRDVDLGVRRELQKTGKTSLYKPLTSARDIGKQWWQSQQKIDTQSDKELGVANNWLDMLRDVETGSEETHK